MSRAGARIFTGDPITRTRRVSTKGDTMINIRTTRTLRALLGGAAGLALAGAAAATAAPAQAAPAAAAQPQVCNLRVTSLEAKDLQEPPRDEISLKLGSDVTNVGTFVDDQTKSGSEMGNPNIDFVGSVNVKLIERDFPSADDVLGSFSQSCNAGNHTKVLTGAGSIYELKYTVSIND